MAAAQAAGAENDFAAGLFEPLPPRYDLLAELLSFGQNRRWRLELVRHVTAASPDRVLDVATGTAGVAIEIASRTQADVTGVDISESMMQRGRERVHASGLDGRITLEVGRAEALRFADAAFDSVSFTYLLRYVADPAATLRELVRVLHPGAPIASLEFFVPPNPFWRAWWWLYTRTLLPVAGGLLGGREWWAVGRFLGPNISSHYRRYPLHSTIGAWRDAGIVDIGTRLMSLGGGLVMWGTRA